MWQSANRRMTSLSGDCERLSPYVIMTRMTETPPPLNAPETNPPITLPTGIKNRIWQSTARLRHLDHVYYLIPLLTLLFFLAAYLSVKYLALPLLSTTAPISPLASSSALVNSESENVAGIATESAAAVEATVTVSPTPATDISTDQSPTPTPTTTPTPAAKPVNVTASRGRINFPNNKFGIYTYAGGDYLDLAAQLVNSNGGDWGWVTIPITLNERNSDNWNGLFSKAKEKHLIPILQISNTNNQVPSLTDIDGIAEFLAGLGWPTKIRAVSLFNEVNAGEYWGGKVDPEGYAQVLAHAADKFHALSSEFFVMNGAFNSSAHTGCVHTDLGVDTCYLSLDEYLRRMKSAVPDIFTKLDGWANHSYPHPAYRGSPYDSTSDQGRLTIRAYKYDLRILAQYGVSLPVFITETGWPHSEGNSTHSEWLDQNTVANYYKAAFTDVWLADPSVVAVTPFQLKRDDFDNFAFVAPDGSKFPQWNAIISIPKTAGAPPVN